MHQHDAANITVIFDTMLSVSLTSYILILLKRNEAKNTLRVSGSQPRYLFLLVN